MNPFHPLVERVSIDLEPLHDPLIRSRLGCLDALRAEELGELVEGQEGRVDAGRKRVDQTLPAIHLHLVDDRLERRPVATQLAHRRQLTDDAPHAVARALASHEIVLLPRRAADEGVEAVVPLILVPAAILDAFPPSYRSPALITAPENHLRRRPPDERLFAAPGDRPARHAPLDFDRRLGDRR